MWASSSHGSCVDVFAPGVDILSAMDTSDTASFSATGTSMAAAHVAGVVALYLQSNMTATPDQVRHLTYPQACIDCIDMTAQSHVLPLWLASMGW